MGPYVTLFVLLALLAGLTVGKAWERYKLQDGRWIDRRRALESPHYMLGTELPGRESDRSRDRGTQHGRRSCRRSIGDSSHSRQSVSGKGAGWTRDPGAPGTASTAAPAKTRTCKRAVMPRARLQARRIRRSCARSFLRSHPPRPRQPLCDVEPREALRGTASMDRCLRDAAEAGGPRSRPTSSRATRRSSPSSKTRLGSTR